MICKAQPFMSECPMLAYAYVPYQQWTGNLMDYDKGLMCGTIFPELYRPFDKKEMSRCE